MGLNEGLSFSIELTKCFLFMFAIYSFTLFPDNVLPVMSSVLMLKENLSGRFGIFHGWIGVFHCASYRTENNNPVLKKWFQSQKRQNKKNNNLLPTFSRQRPYAQWTSKRQGR